MALEKGVWGIGGIDQERLPREFNIVDSGLAEVGRRTGGTRKKAKPGKIDRSRPKGSAEEVQGGSDAVQDNQGTAAPIAPEDRQRAREILDEIGAKFAENRKKGKSNAWEEYQRDLALNMNYLVLGGVMNLKEISQTLMQIEEYRKQTSEHGKTPSTLLAEWLSGGNVDLS